MNFIYGNYKKKLFPCIWTILSGKKTVQGVRYGKLKKDLLTERNKDNVALNRDLEIIKEKNKYLQAIQGASESEEHICLIELLENLAANVPEFEK